MRRAGQARGRRSISGKKGGAKGGGSCHCANVCVSVCVYVCVIVCVCMCLVCVCKRERGKRRKERGNEVIATPSITLPLSSPLPALCPARSLQRAHTHPPTPTHTHTLSLPFPTLHARHGSGPGGRASSSQGREKVSSGSLLPPLRAVLAARAARKANAEARRGRRGGRGQRGAGEEERRREAGERHGEDLRWCPPSASPA